MNFRITREALLNGEVRELQRRHANVHPDLHWRSEAEMERLLHQALAELGEGKDLWVFGYGSLIWNPAIDYAEKRLALLRGWHRRFCLKMYMGRGTPEHPGLMLALDRGGSCQGVVFRVEAEKARQELTLLWQREMYGGSYNYRWVMVQAGNERLRALTFVVNRAHPRYVPELSVEQTAQMIAAAKGELGSCQEYLENTIGHLRQLGVRDAGLERIAAALPKR